MRKSITTAQDVAELAGVSRSAVSRCFSGAGNVSKGKQVRIVAAAEKLGYRPNALARSLTGQKTDLVALITTEHLSARSNEHLSKLTLSLSEAGKRALVIPVGDNTTIDESSLRAIDYKVDAIVVMGGNVSGKIVELLSEAQVPLFLYSRDHDSETSPGFSCDNASGGIMAARLFLRANRKRLSYLGKNTHPFPDRNRRRGYTEEICQHGFELHSEASDESNYEGGRRAASILFSAKTVPDAVFCFNDTMAFGALQAAREFNLRVPEDVAVLGFDDQPMASWHAFELSTIGYDPSELARLAATKILDAINGENASPQTYYIQPKIIIRKTAP